MPLSSGALGIAPVVTPSLRSVSDTFHTPVLPDMGSANPVKGVPDYRDGQIVSETISNETNSTPTSVPANFSQPEYPSDRIIVKFKDDIATAQGTKRTQIASVNSEIGASVIEDYTDKGLPGMQLVKLSGTTVADAVQKYEKLPIVEYAEPDYLLHIDDGQISTPVIRNPSSSVTSGTIVVRPSVPDVTRPGSQSPHSPPIVTVPQNSKISNQRTLATPITTNNPNATQEGNLLIAPASKEFLEYMKSGKKEILVDGEHTGGYAPSPINSSYLRGQHIPGASVSSYPSSFDLRNTNKTTSVKNQGNCGSCWAHGTYGSLESVMMPEEKDFSENNLKDHHGFDWGPCDGGNNYISAAYLGRWSGPVHESDDPYLPYADSSPATNEVAGHVQDIIVIPPKSSPLSNDDIKWVLTNHGGISASYYHTSSSYSSTYAAYYYPTSTSDNHVITIVGWDDNFPASRFTSTPAGNGAFLCKNSWGTGWGQSGYFWVSYYDMNLGYQELFSYMSAEPASRYSTIYQYDPYGWVFDFGYDEPVAYMANVFTATGSEQLAAAGFYTPETNCQYQITIYTGVSSGPTSGTLQKTTSGSLPYPGYHTVSIPGVNLTSGEKFSIVVKITTQGYGYPIAIEYPYPGYASGVTASPGQSYYGYDGVTFYDITDDEANTNICLKAFTVGNATPTPTPTITPTPTSTATPTPTPTITPTPTTQPGPEKIPNDPLFSNLWGMHNTGQSGGTVDADIDAPEAWSVNTGSPSTIIAVIDTGVDYLHPDLSANIWTNSDEIAGNGIDDDANGYIDDTKGWNFVSDTNNPMDDNSHGTHCAGTIAAVGNNGLGVAGVCWTARIMPLKFLDSSGSGYTSDAISAILYANRNGAHVLSNSWGGGGYSQSLKDAIDASPAIVICAAGNSASNTDMSPQYPSSYTSSNIIAVAATDRWDQLASFSNYGANSVDVAAPGVSIYSTTPSNSYGSKSGTSMATPHVAGLAGLIKSTNPSLTNQEIKTVIMSTTDPKSSLSGKCVTGGRINADRAVRLINQPAQEAKFYGVPGITVFPMTIQLFDVSTGNPSSRLWDFGDNTTSTEMNPIHTYNTPGTFTITLTVQ